MHNLSPSRRLCRSTKTGIINFFDGGTNIGSGVITGTTATFMTSSLSVGSHNMTAQVNSDSSPVLVQVVNKASPAVTVNTSGPSTYGDSVTITATVPAGVTGTVTFTSGTLTLGSGTISSGTVSITTTALPAPSDLITATYSGDAHNNSATGTMTQTVAKATPASTLTSSPNPSLPGSLVTLTDTLPNNVTGTVTFTNGTTALGHFPGNQWGRHFDNLNASARQRYDYRDLQRRRKYQLVSCDRVADRGKSCPDADGKHSRPKRLRQSGHNYSFCSCRTYRYHHDHQRRSNVG